MPHLHAHLWQPIANLPGDWQQSLVNPQTTALVQVWHEQQEHLRERDLYKQFLAKLQRQWAIETGAIEGLYTLSEGATLTLIEKGLDASLITHEDTNDAPERVIAKIQDQHHAILGLYDFVSGERPLGTSYVKELHQVLTAHQETYVGRDQFGTFHDIPLPRGVWKQLPNNVEHPDGSRFEYCPPEHVDQEMDNLIAWHYDHETQDIPADVEAAWLHHRFTLIHPFSDGNGRVARCLATLMLLKAHWLPLVITREERSKYIEALRAADDGDLKSLVDLFGSLQRKAIREALSISDDVVREATAVQSILQSVREKLSERKRPLSDRAQRVFAMTDSLQELAVHKLEEVAQQIQDVIRVEDETFTAFVDSAPRGTEKAMFNWFQMCHCEQPDIRASNRRDQAWTALKIQMYRQVVLLISFHAIGYDDSGVAGCTPLAYVLVPRESGIETAVESESLADEPFEFTYAESPAEVQQRFQSWLDECVVKGLDYWRKNL